MWKVKWQYLSRRRVVFVINMSYSVSLRCHKPLSYFIMTLCLHNLENFYILILFGYPLMFEHLTFFSCRNIFQYRDKKVRNADSRPVSRIFCIAIAERTHIHCIEMLLLIALHSQKKIRCGWVFGPQAKTGSLFCSS